jgi:hypothetical protein
MDIFFTIQTDDPTILQELLGKPSDNCRSIAIPGIGQLTLENRRLEKSFVTPETLTFALAFASGVSSGILANWLYDKLKGRKLKLLIEEHEIRVEKTEIFAIVDRITRK